jgi:predicted nucleotidyltransferase
MADTPKRSMALLQEKRQEVLQIAERYGVRNIRVFGSTVRGEDRPDSDIDLLVRMEDARDLFDFIGFKLDIADLLGKKIDLISENGIHHLLRERILHEARPL